MNILYSYKRDVSMNMGVVIENAEIKKVNPFAEGRQSRRSLVKTSSLLPITYYFPKIPT